MLIMSKSKPYDLHDRLGYKLALVARINDQFMDAGLAEIGLTRQMWCVLVAVGEQKICQPSEIASYIGINRSAVSRTLRDMDSKGMLERHCGSGDGRSTLVSLTDEGCRLLTASLPISYQSQVRMAESLSSREQAQLARLLDKFLSVPHGVPSHI